MAGLLAMAGCGSLPTLGRSEPDSSLRLATIFLSAGAPDAALRAADAHDLAPLISFARS